MDVAHDTAILTHRLELSSSVNLLKDSSKIEFHFASAALHNPLALATIEVLHTPQQIKDFLHLNGPEATLQRRASCGGGGVGGILPSGTTAGGGGIQHYDLARSQTFVSGQMGHRSHQGGRRGSEAASHQQHSFVMMTPKEAEDLNKVSLP